MSRKWSCALVALGAVLAAGPACALSVSLLPPGPFSPGDDTGFFVSGIDSTGYFEFSFSVSAPVSLNVANGVESNLSAKKDMSNLVVQLTGSASDPTVVYVVLDSTVVSSRTVDGFYGAWANLIPSQTYTLKVSYDLTSSGSADTFAGQLSFASAPIPPAIALFGSGLFGLALLSRRSRRSNPPLRD